MIIIGKDKLIYGSSYFAGILLLYLGIVGAAALFEKELGIVILGMLAISISGLGILVLNKYIFNRHNVSSIYKTILFTLALVCTLTLSVYFEAVAS
jgi:hypothetical protein